MSRQGLPEDVLRAFWLSEGQTRKTLLSRGVWLKIGPVAEEKETYPSLHPSTSDCDWGNLPGMCSGRDHYEYKDTDD